jgi:hypothetical protein
MRECPLCHSMWETYFLTCKCGYDFRTGELATGESAATTEAAASGDSRSAKLLTRYVDGYRVGRALDGLGMTIKGVGFVVSALLVIVSLMMMLLNTSTNQIGIAFGGGVAGILMAVFVAGNCFILGSLISAQGQILTATLDSAVNTSPFMDNENRMKIMSLS